MRNAAPAAAARTRDEDRRAEAQQADGPVVGIIANPVSARDIRRVVANANSLQLADRVNIVLRALAALGACGVKRVLMMPDREGLKPMLLRHLARERAAAGDGPPRWPQLDWLAMPVTARVDDSFRAARLLREAGVAAIVVLGGDGTHRAVVRECGAVPTRACRPAPTTPTPRCARRRWPGSRWGCTRPVASRPTKRWRSTSGSTWR